MKIHRLYADRNGESHFEDVEVQYVESSRAGRLSKRWPATGIIFREVQPDYDLDWHPAPRRQYIINLDAGVQITASDGEARKIQVGNQLFVAGMTANSPTGIDGGDSMTGQTRAVFTKIKALVEAAGGT